MILHDFGIYTLSLFCSIVSLRTLLIIVSVFIFFKKSKKKTLIYDGKVSISIVIPVHHNEKGIAKNLCSLLDIDKDLRREVLLIIDGPSRGVLQQIWTLSKKYNNLKIFSVEKSGKSCALNKGIKEAKGDVIVISDIDNRWPEGSLKKLTDHFKYSDLECISGQAIPLNTKGFLNNCQVVEYFAFYIDRLASSTWQGATIPGAIGAFRKRVFNKAGLFDPDIEGEDFNASLNILERGFSIICEPEALVYTQGTPYFIKDLIRQRARWYRGIGQVFNRHFKNIMFKKIDLKSRLKSFWHLFNLQIYYYIVFVAEVWCLVYAIVSGDRYLFLIWKAIITINLLYYFLVSRIILRKQLPIPKLKYILFFSTIYFYFLIGIRIFFQILSIFGKKIEWDRNYAFQND